MNVETGEEVASELCSPVFGGQLNLRYEGDSSKSGRKTFCSNPYESDESEFRNRAIIANVMGFERLEHTQSGSGLFAELRGTRTMDSIIYLVGLIVVVMFILSLLGLH